MKRLWSWMALNQAQRVDRAMWPPTTAGWARSTTKIPPGLNGANCRRIPALRGLASLAAAATAIIEFIFSGGTSTPHDYKGASYDGTPADVSTVTFAYELHGHRWKQSTRTPTIPAPTAAAFWKLRWDRWFWGAWLRI